MQKEEDLLATVQKPWQGPTASSEATGERAGERLRPQHAQRATVPYYDPLTTLLPRAPSLRVYCGYGHGIATERAYHYRHSPVLCDSEQCPAGMLETDLSNSQARCRPPDPPCSSDALQRVLSPARPASTRLVPRSLCCAWQCSCLLVPMRPSANMGAAGLPHSGAIFGTHVTRCET